MLLEDLMRTHLLKTPTDAPSEGQIAYDRITDFAAILTKMQQFAVPHTLERVQDMQDQLAQFRVRVSLVGQVKAGKTALANSLINKPDMLPSDVNPWTTVVTSVHINTPKPRNHRAVFTFFTQDEWDNMVDIGGLLGDAARRANFEVELAEVKVQIEEMQANAERRLGKNFKYLLNGTHNFTGFHPELIKRYVCLGDEEGVGPKAHTCFADLTKSADLYTDDASYPLPIVFRDTPGVNDPFLVREAVTIDNLADTDICVIVLSAHQAFSTSDIALMRVILALKHEQIVLFVNRIDELDDPDHQITEIDTFVRATLKEQGLPETVPIVFGSANWAKAASFGLTEGALLGSEDILQKLIDDRTNKPDVNLMPYSNGSPGYSNYKSHDLSGLTELRETIEAKSAQMVVVPMLEELRTQALDICQQSRVLLEQTLDNASPVRDDLDIGALIDQLDDMLQKVDADCDRVTKACSEKMLYDMSAAYRDFIENETKDIETAAKNGVKLSEWTADIETLTRALNKAYRSFNQSGQEAIQEIFHETAVTVSAFYADIFNADSQLFTVQTPVAHEAKTPTTLMQSSTMDITIGWLGGWFTSKMKAAAFSKRFSAIATDEMKTTIKEMQDVYIADFIKTARLDLFEFLSGHILTLQNLSVLDGPRQRNDMRRKLGIDAEINARLLTIADIHAELQAKTDTQAGAN